MIIDEVTKLKDHWVLRGPLNSSLQLPAMDPKVAVVDIGTIGTRRRNAFKGKVTEQFAKRLAEMNRPVTIVDVRRTGAGGSGSWGPLEFATKIPRMLSSSGNEYAYFHLPIAAPSETLLADWRAGVEEVTRWAGFRDAYMSELSEDAILAVRAFVESAAAVGGIAILLCAEPCCLDFDSLEHADQDKVYCHRFTLVNLVARALHNANGKLTINRVDLSIEKEHTVTQLY